jgi:hypothetical protein
MTQYRIPRKTVGGQPAWEVQAREEAARLGVSEKKVKQRVEKELIRLVAEKIAQHEITWLRTQHAASRKIAAQPSVKAEKAPLRTKVSRPGASDLNAGTQITSGTQPSKEG